MKRLLSTIIISILFVTPSFAESTQEMLSACKSLTTNIKMSGDKATISNTFDGGKCWGALYSGVLAFLFIYSSAGALGLQLILTMKMVMMNVIEKLGSLLASYSGLLSLELQLDGHQFTTVQG